MTITATPVRNLNLVRVTWNSVTFDCTAKELPSLKDAPTWSIVTDNTSDLTGRTIVGKPEGFEPFELTIETELDLIYDTLLMAMLDGTVSNATFTYTPPSGTAVTLTVPKCSLCGIENVKNKSNGGNTTIIKLQPEGGQTTDMPSVT